MTAVMSFFRMSHFMASANATTPTDQLCHDSTAWKAPCTPIVRARSTRGAWNGREHVASEQATDEMDCPFMFDTHTGCCSRADAGISGALHGSRHQHESRRCRTD